MKTFDDLGIPFPLFQGPTDEASEYVGIGRCSLCASADRHCFALWIGGRLIISCPICNTEIGLDTADRANGKCRSCSSIVVFPSIPVVEFPSGNGTVEKIQICYSCLRGGKGAITQDTEFGMVTWEFAMQGITHGVPGLRTAEFEKVPIAPEDDWYGIRVPREHLFELIRTPGYITWQGTRWLFCCKLPMTYIGAWQSLKTLPIAGAIFNQLLDSLLKNEKDKDMAIECLSNGTGCIYTFRCRTCNKLRANWDID